MNVVKEIQSITDKEINNGIFGGVTGGSWHEKYSKSAWVYVGKFFFSIFFSILKLSIAYSFLLVDITSIFYFIILLLLLYIFTFIFICSIGIIL